MYNYRKKTELNFIPIIIIVYYSISPFLYLIRTIFGDTGSIAIILRSSEPILLALTFSLCIMQGKFKFNSYSFTFFLLGLYGLLIAIAQKNKAIDILAGYLHFMTGLTLLIYFYDANNHIRMNIDKFMTVLSYSTLVCYSVVLTIMYCSSMLLGFHIYLGLACQVLIIIFFYNIQKRRIFLYLFSLLLIILSGKRGVFSALLMGFFISLYPLVKQLHFKNIMKIFCTILLTICLISMILPNVIDQLLHKYTYSETSTIDNYSAGRWNEIISAYNEWTSTIENIIIGSGFGFTYTYIHSLTNAADTDNYKNVHFSYLNPIIIFGAPMASIYFICLCLLLIKILYYVNPNISYLKWSSLTYLIYACFVFDLFDEPIFWMINGVLFNYTVRETNVI